MYQHTLTVSSQSAQHFSFIIVHVVVFCHVSLITLTLINKRDDNDDGLLLLPHYSYTPTLSITGTWPITDAT